MSPFPQEKHLTCPAPESDEAYGTSGFHHLHYMEWGERETSRASVICVHGLTRNSRDFDLLACVLVAKGFHVIAPDMPGRGKSDWLPHGSLYSYPLYVSDCSFLLAQLGIHRVHWVGTSMGGLISMMTEFSGPHIIDKLVLNDVGPFVPKEASRRIGEYIAKPESFPDREAAETHLRTIMQPFGITEEHHWQHIFTHSIVENPDGTAQLAYDPAIAHAFRTKSGKLRPLPDIDLWAMWDALTCPTLVIRGEESDLLLPETAARMVKKPDVSLMEIPHVGHAPALMNEQQIALICDWLTQ